MSKKVDIRVAQNYKNRSVVMQQTMLEFKEKKPKLAAIHWDGTLMNDVT